MSYRERWTKKFVESLIKDEKKPFRLWLDFSEEKARGCGVLFTFNNIGVSLGPLLTSRLREIKTLFRSNHRERCNPLR